MVQRMVEARQASHEIGAPLRSARASCFGSHGRRLALLSLGLLWLLPVGFVRANTGPELQVTGMTFVASRDEGSPVVLRASRARFDTSAEVAFLEEVDAEVPAEGEAGGFEMRCDESEVDLSSNDFLAQGNVRGRADRDREFVTEWVRYDHAEALLYTEAPVLITEAGVTYRGGGFRYHIRDRRFRLTGGASIIQLAEPSESPDSEPSSEEEP